MYGKPIPLRHGYPLRLVVPSLYAWKSASYVSHFVGRIDDISGEGMKLIRDIMQILNKYGIDDTEVIVASVWHPMHEEEAALIGADI